MHRHVSVLGLAFGCILSISASSGLIAAEPRAGEPSAQDLRAALDHHRALGKAYYENDKFAEAAGEYRWCIESGAATAADHFNLGLVQMRATQYEEALEALRRAEETDSELLAVQYVRGIIHKRQGEYEQAVADLRHVIARNPTCVGAHYNLGVCYKFMQAYEEAIAAFNKEAELAPTHPSTHYQLITLYRRLGQVDNAERHKEIYDRVKDTVDEAEKTAEALERSQYTYIIEPDRLSGDLEPQGPDGMQFVDRTEDAGWAGAGSAPPVEPLPERLRAGEFDAAAVRGRYASEIGGRLALGDFDADGDLDVYAVHSSIDSAAAVNRLWRNEGEGRFVDVTEAAGVGNPGLGMDAVFGDYDNDGRLDLYVVNCGANVLYRNEGDGRFTQVSEEARANEPQCGRQAIFVDYDHDNDLDLYVVNDVAFSAPSGAEEFAVPAGLPGEANTLLRNNGNGTFSDYTDAAGLLVEFSQSRAALAGDFEGDQDLDLFVVNFDSPSRLFANARLGKYEANGRFAPELAAGARAARSGDFNRDGKMDLLIAGPDTIRMYVNEGQAQFTGEPVLDNLTADRIELLDYNNDGWVDLLVMEQGGRSLRLLAAIGKGRFADVSEAVGLDRFLVSGDSPQSPHRRLRDVAASDIDGDGDEDIVALMRDHALLLMRNEDGEKRSWLTVKLAGKKVNRDGIGAVIEVSSGGHYQKRNYEDGPLHFGLGKLTGVDVVRVTWPNGVAQNVIQPPIRRELVVEEYVKVSASCGFLYAYDGLRFHLVNEILGIGPLGVPMAPGVYHQPDCTELTFIDGALMSPREGMFELRLTEELRETMYADQFTLRAVDHPRGLEIIPNEMFTAPPFPEDRFFAVGDARPPVAAVDQDGADVLPLILERDGRFPPLRDTPYEGLAERHSLTLDLGDLAEAENLVLFLDGWIYWPESSTVMAIAQDPRFQLEPLRLEARDSTGAWRTVVASVGLPTSKGIVVPVELGGELRPGERHIRLSTNLCVHFDRIFLSNADSAASCRVTEMPVAEATLRYRGFSVMERDRFGFERFDYAEVRPTGSWDPPQGLFTRYGSVTELLARPDDMFVIFGPGDELVMRFDPSGLPALPDGWTRDFVLYANGWVKDGDLNTLHSQTVEPLPFLAMSGYPYGDDEHYPDDPEHRRYRSEYNTRESRSTSGMPDVQPTIP